MTLPHVFCLLAVDKDHDTAIFGTVFWDRGAVFSHVGYLGAGFTVAGGLQMFLVDPDSLQEFDDIGGTVDR